MASAWGSSWGSAWGDSWGSVSPSVAIFYTASPSRFGTCFATHAPAVAPTPVPSPEPAPEPEVTTAQSGVRKQFRVRRSDFSSQKNYEFALRAALLEANFAIRPSDNEPVVIQKSVKPAKVPRETLVPDTEIKISAAQLAALQHAAEMDELEMLQLFITVIESEWP